MPKDMTDEEFEAEVDDADELETYDQVNEENADDWISFFLYRAKDGRLFREVRSSFDSDLSGSTIRQWLEESEKDSWKDT